jgi:hypothetical protein
MYSHKQPFADGNIVSAMGGRYTPSLPHYMAELVVCFKTMSVLKDRHEALTSSPHRMLKRLYEAIEADERILILT